VKKDETGYVVLKQEDVNAEAGIGTDTWTKVEGATVKEAVEKGGEGIYVQVPKRSWKPRTAKVEQVKKVTLS